MNNRLKCALIGYGYWGKILEKYLIRSEHIDLITIYDLHVSNNTSLEVVLADKTLEAVFVCTPIDTHYSIVKSCLQHGKHVFCEKPLTKYSKEARELANLAIDKNLCLYTDYIYTLSPSINYIKDHMDQIGFIKCIECEILQFGNFYKQDSVEDVLGVHLISAILYLIGETEEIVIKQYFKIRCDECNILESYFELSSPKVPKIFVKCSLVSNIKSRKIVLIGEKGNFVFDMLGPNTVMKFLIKKEIIGYSVIDDYCTTFNESNNLAGVIDRFYNEIASGSSGNLKLSLAVTSIVEQLKRY